MPIPEERQDWTLLTWMTEKPHAIGQLSTVISDLWSRVSR